MLNEILKIVILPAVLHVQLWWGCQQERQGSLWCRVNCQCLSKWKWWRPLQVVKIVCPTPNGNDENLCTFRNCSFQIYNKEGCTKCSVNQMLFRFSNYDETTILTLHCKIGVQAAGRLWGIIKLLWAGFGCASTLFTISNSFAPFILLKCVMR